MPSSVTWLSVAERPPPGPLPDGRCLAVHIRTEAGRELLGKVNAGGIRLLGAPRVQLTFDDLDPITHWRPVDERQLEEFENG